MLSIMQSAHEIATLAVRVAMQPATIWSGRAATLPSASHGACHDMQWLMAEQLSGSANDHVSSHRKCSIM